MKNHLSTWISSCILAIVSLTASTSALAAGKEDEAVANANMGFYTALNRMFIGELASMTGVWSHAADVTYMGPVGGLKVGWTEVLKDWEAQAAMKLGGKVETSDVKIVVGKDIAVVCNYEKGEINVEGKVQKVSIRATNTYRKEDGKWKMIGHHTDLLPYLAN